MKERMRQCVNYPISNLVCYNYTNKRPSDGITAKPVIIHLKQSRTCVDTLPTSTFKKKDSYF
jgi:hypothetical protein